ncbi:ribokinase [Catellatospora tritici]|uniref:ribokinase n=1 Tax=Catellatospora tritici TaxID=2851566 RepID=UPI001C2CE3E3|nr:ribokinase [Catellatospora tritici]MBV1851499.1 ribokinase [Catellatospora tritici]
MPPEADVTANVVVVGSANMDLVVSAATLPRPGETVLGDDFLTVPGGKGANQAVAAARAGARCHFLGAVGRDAFGDELRGSLAAAGVDLDGLRRVDRPSGVALIAVDAAAENLIVVAPGANTQLVELDAADLELIAGSDVVVCQLEIPPQAVAQALRAGRAAGTLTILNAAPAPPSADGLLDAVDVLVVNRGEAAALAGADGTPDELLKLLLAAVPRVVLTLGATGAAYADRDGVRLEVPAPQVEAVDTTAAGDAFTGALAVALGQGRPMLDALRWACAAGACCARNRGASTSLPTAADIDTLYTSWYGAAP